MFQKEHSGEIDQSVLKEEGCWMMWCWERNDMTSQKQEEEGMELEERI